MQINCDLIFMQAKFCLCKVPVNSFRKVLDNYYSQREVMSTVYH